MTTQLQAALDALYRAFAAVPKPRDIPRCPCCLDEEEARVLLDKPLREISAEELSTYAACALLTVGEPADYRYYLPRILETHVRCDGWWPDIEVIGRAMHSAGWSQWSEAERTAIEHFFLTRAAELVAAGDIWSLDGFICGAVRARLPIQPLFAQIAASPEIVLEYYGRNANAMPHGKLSNAFWEDDLEGAKIVLDWFFSPEIRGIILDGIGVDLSAVPRA